MLLAHANKHRDAEGDLIYEGTGDLRADVDELIYLEKQYDEVAGISTISTYPDKVRNV